MACVSENPFETPNVEAGAPTDHAGALPWFPVAPGKLTVMNVATFGLYSVYWFERQFRFQKQHFGRDSWPLARALFSIFFVTGLARDVDIAAHDADLNVPWKATTTANTFIVISIASTLVNRLDPFGGGPIGTSIGLVVSLVLMGLAATPLATLQTTINQLLARGYPHHTRNDRYSVLNIVWLVLVVLLVGFTIFFNLMVRPS